VEQLQLPLDPTDIVPLSQFVKDNPQFFPAGKASADQQVRARKENGLEAAGGVTKRNGVMYAVVPRYVAWFAGQ
jgi:hypothetical protein